MVYRHMKNTLDYLMDNPPAPLARVVNLSKEDCDVYIGRPSKWGNPYKLGRDGTRFEVILKYRAYVTEQIDNGVLDISELQGKRLGCYCAPKACHGDVLTELANLSR